MAPAATCSSCSRPPASRIVRMAVPLDVEVALPTEWHESPVALDPLEPVPRD